MSFIFTFLTLSPICYFSLLSHTNTHTQVDSVFFLSRYHDADHDDNNNNDESSKVQLSLTSNVTTTEQTQNKHRKKNHAHCITTKQADRNVKQDSYWYWLKPCTIHAPTPFPSQTILRKEESYLNLSAVGSKTQKKKLKTQKTEKKTSCVEKPCT